MTDASSLRVALLELHRALLEAQRVQAERFGGRMSSAELLRAAALQDHPEVVFARRDVGRALAG